MSWRRMGKNGREKMQSPNEGKLVTFPCDHASWIKIKPVLRQLQKQNDISSIFANLSKLHTTVTEGLCQGDAQIEERNPFKNLQKFYKTVATEKEQKAFVEVILPSIVNRALDIEKLKPKQGLQYSTKQKDGKYQLSRQFVASILSCSFLCLYDRRKADKANFLCPINFNRFLLLLPGLSQAAKLRCILHYFERIAGDVTGPVGNITYIRQVTPKDKLPSLETWRTSNKELCPLIVRQDGGIEDAGSNTLQVDFANKFIGGGVLSAGKVQEEIRFCISPELIASMLFMESMEDNEAILIRGFETFSQYSGYASTFHFDGPHYDRIENRNNLNTLLCAIDALPRRRMRPHQQYQATFIMRELNKAYTGFCQPDADRMSQLIQQKPSPSTAKGQKSVSTEDDFYSALESLDPDGLEAVEDTLTDFTATMSKGIVANAVMDAARDPKLGSREEDDEYPTDAAQLNAACLRRRSSNLSDISSRRSSHSTHNSVCSDLSEDLSEDQYEGYHRSERKHKHATIKEESINSAMHEFAANFVEQILMEGYAIASQMNPGVHDFDSNKPLKTSTKQRPFRSVVRRGSNSSSSSNDSHDNTTRKGVVNYVDSLFSNNVVSRHHNTPPPFRSRTQPHCEPESAEIKAAALYVEKMFHDVLFGDKGKKLPKKTPPSNGSSTRNSSPESASQQGSAASLAQYACAISKGIVSKAVSDLASDSSSSSGSCRRVCTPDQDNQEHQWRNANMLANRIMNQALKDVTVRPCDKRCETTEPTRQLEKEDRMSDISDNKPKNESRPDANDTEKLAQNVLRSALHDADIEIKKHNSNNNSFLSGANLSPCYEVRLPHGAQNATCTQHSDAQFHYYAESVVSSILSEAVGDMRDSRPRAPPHANESVQANTPKRKTSSQYFNEEMRRGSLDEDLSHFAEDLARRSSLDDLNKLRRRSSSGFRDITLSNFADELIQSNPNSPSLAMFNSRDRTSSRGSSRRNSYDIRLGNSSRKGSLVDRVDGDRSLDRISIGTSDSGLVDNSRLQSLEKVSAHENILEWLNVKKQSSKKKTKKRTNKHKATSHIDWFVQDLLVDTFHDAFSTMFGDEYLYDFHHNRKQNSQEQGSYVERFATQFTDSILESAVCVCEEETEMVLTSGGEDLQGREAYEDAVNVPYSLLESFADTMADSILSECFMCMSDAAAMEQVETVRPIATGNWGCGAFGGDPQLKSLLQWIVASFCDAPAVLYYTFNNSSVAKLEEVSRLISRRGWTVGKLVEAILKYQDYSSAILCQGDEEPPSLFHMLLTQEL